MVPGELQRGRPRRLHRLGAAGEPGNRLSGEQEPGPAVAVDHPALGVVRDEAGKGVIDKLRVEDRDREDVGDQGERVHTGAQASDAQLTRLERRSGCGKSPNLHSGTGRPHWCGSPGAEEFLAELADHGTPQAQVSAFGFWRADDRLEDADRDDLVQAVGVGTLAGLRQCSRNDVPSAGELRTVSVLIATLAGRRDRSHGSPTSAPPSIPPADRRRLRSCQAGCGLERVAAQRHGS